MDLIAFIIHLFSTTAEALMSGKIFYRTRRKTSEGEKKPRYRVVAVSGVDLKVYSDHLRMAELTHIAEAVDAELVCLPRGEKHDDPCPAPTPE